ncbi:hypothetical protein ACSS6W_004633 [Trichoderma asperelloides]
MADAAEPNVMPSQQTRVNCKCPPESSLVDQSLMQLLFVSRISRLLRGDTRI